MTTSRGRDSQQSPGPSRRALVYQYSDACNLKARIELHVRFSTNQYGWPRWLYERIDPRPPQAILEIGCGPAVLWSTTLEQIAPGLDLVLTDLFPGMIKEARDNTGDGFSYVVSDAQALPFGDESFDSVVANHMLYHVPDRQRAFGEIARVLKLGGVLFAATNGANHMIQLDELLAACGGPRAVDPHVRNFGLESGPPQLEPHFEKITIDRYEDSLRVTEAEPVIDYLQSMTVFWEIGGFSSELADCARSIVEAQIAKDGFFFIQKDAGLIRARRR